jgi:putative two-component system response regulator
MSHAEASAIIEAGRGTHFDPEIVDVYTQINGKLAAVAEQFGKA